jgi:LAO/AO transport system kinase
VTQQRAPRAPINRRALGRALSRIADASVAQALAVLEGDARADGEVWRCGITGPAGVGKSSLVGRFVNARLAHQRRVGVVAIDPSSPYSQGAILGDRIRIDAHGDDAELFVRSLASRRSRDGLADNIANVLALLEGHDFDDVIVETVGAGQSQYEVRELVDTLVVVLMPGAGDMVQAVKAGILETGDIYVINKADRPGAKEMVGEIASVLRHPSGPDDWLPPVVLTSALAGDGIAELDAAAEAHRAWRARHLDVDAARRQRRRAHVRALVARRLAEVIEASDDALWDADVASAYHAVVAGLGYPGE